MPNIKSAMKRDEKSKLQNLKNKAEKSALKTNLKKFDAAVAEGNRDAAVRPRGRQGSDSQEQRSAQEVCDGSENERAWLIHRISGAWQFAMPFLLP